MDKVKNVELFTERLVLTSISLEDCGEKYLSWLNDDDVNMYLESGFFKHDINGLREYVSSYVSNENAVLLVIRLKDSLKHIGNVKIDKISYHHQNCEYGIMMGDKSEWGKGYAREATFAIVNYAFNNLNLNKVNLGVIDSNIHAIKLYRNIGFEIEGVLKQNFFERRTNTLRNELRMTLFRKSWKYDTQSEDSSYYSG